MRSVSLTAVAVLFTFIACSQSHFSEAYNELLKQRTMYDYPAGKWDSLRCARFGECPPAQQQQPVMVNTCPLTKRFFGWHMINTSSASYQWALMTDLSYFSYDVDPATGNAKNPSQMAAFPNDTTVVKAIANNVRVSLCATLFNTAAGEFSSFFGNPTAQSTLITNLINTAIAGNARGINIDFEGSGLNTTYATQFTNFMNSLSSQLHAAIPGGELSIDLQGSFSGSTTFITGLQNAVDLFILMGYDYYWGSQLYPGPVAPTYQFPKATSDPNGHGSVSNDLNNLIKTIGTEKTILAMPYYGRRWRTTNGCVIPANGNGPSISSQTYAQFRDNVSGYYSNTLREINTFNAWHCFNDVNGVPNEQFIDDTISLQKKYDIVRQRGIPGVAVWKLGNDAGYNDCWNLVNNNLTSCSVVPVKDTIYDMGGPTGNYHNNENYVFTVDPPGATSVILNFMSFDVEAGYDYLRIFNGTDTTAPLIAFLHGNILPAPVIASTGKMTIKFRADGGTTKPGFKAYYNAYYCLGPRRTIASGNLSDPTIWACGLPPSANDSVEIQSGHSVTIPVSGQIKHLKIHSGGSLVINDPGITLTVGNVGDNSNIVVIEGSLFITSGTLLINGNLEFGPAHDLSLGGTLNITGYLKL